MRTRTTLALAALVVAACAKKEEASPAAPDAGASAAAGAAAPADRILLGHVTSMTGDQATFGQSADRGLRLAVNEQNAKGGVKGHRVELKTLDDQGKPEESAVAATRLITQDHVTVLIGNTASSRSMAMAPIADTYGVPMVSPSSTSAKVTKDGDKTRPYVFRVCFIDPFQGTVMARFALETLKVQNVAILRDVGNDYSVGLADAFAAKLKELGGTVVGDESYKAGDRDFKAQLTSLKAKDPQAVYVPGYYMEVANIAQQARELGVKVPLMGGDGWDSRKLFEVGGRAVDGCYFSSHYAPEEPDPRVKDFVKRYREAWGEPPDGFAALGYDAARVAMDAMTRASELTGTAIKDAIAATKAFPGVTGPITVDGEHNVVKSAVVLEVKNGGAKYVATVKP
jgi:branched-chain amino acid transport system substrate-binding protein